MLAQLVHLQKKKKNVGAIGLLTLKIPCAIGV